MYDKSAAPTESEREIVGHSPAFQRVLNQVGIIARSDSVTLIQGETGTGKEVIARATHNKSLRSRGPLFLDEIGDLPLELQPKLLRAAETGVRAAGERAHNSSLSSAPARARG